MSDRDDDALLRAVALRNAASIQAARRRAEEELLRAKEALEVRSRELAGSLAMMKATLEATTDAILVTDAERRVIASNDRFVRLWGLPQELLATADHHRMMVYNAEQFSDPGAFLRRIDEICNSDDDEVFDLLKLKDGRVFERFSRAQRVGGRNVGRVWTVRDITAQRRAEDALREEARVLDTLNKTGRLIASTLELETVLQAVTDAATEISGAAFGAFFYTTTGPDGDTLMLYTLSGAPLEAFERFGKPRATALFGPTFRGEGTIRIDDVLTDPRYGRWGPHHGMPAGHLPVRSYLAVPVFSRAGSVLGGLIFGHPTPGVFDERAERVVNGIAAQAAVAIDHARLYEDTRRLAQERQTLVDAERSARSYAERMSQVKDEFVATLSHELRTPLTAVLGWSKALLVKSDDPGNLRRGLEAIERNARAQAQLIEDLLDINRIVSGKIRLDAVPTAIEPVVTAAVDAVRPSAEAKAQRLTTSFEPEVGEVHGDPDRLQQIVWNLLSNSVKFTPDGGSVHVAVKRSDAGVRIEVSDTGMGIEPEFLPHVFDRFRQADSSTTRQYRGLGLGLSIVKQLVELHGGKVAAESQGKGRGATFSVWLPLAQNAAAQRPTAAAARSAAEEVHLDGLKVLVIDDEPDARDLICHVLRESSAEVTGAPGAAEGLSLVRRDRPDVIVSDIGMPDTDGYEFIRALRRLPDSEGGRTPAVALTAFARSEDRTRAITAGFQVHLSKPIEPQELVAAVGRIAGRTAAPRAVHALAEANGGAGDVTTAAERFQ